MLQKILAFVAIIAALPTLFSCGNRNADEVDTEIKSLINAKESSKNPVVKRCEWKYSGDADKLYACFRARSVDIVNRCDWKYSHVSDILKECFMAWSVEIINNCDWKYSSYSYDLKMCLRNGYWYLPNAKSR